MLVIKNGNLLESTENIICHQCNENGIFGAGLALQVARKYPLVEADYKGHCLLFGKNDLYGQYQTVKIGDKKYIANCFTQRDFNTNLKDIEKVFRGLLETCKQNSFTISIPYKYGCGIANGNWEEVSSLLEKLSNEYEIDIIVYKLEED